MLNTYYSYWNGGFPARMEDFLVGRENLPKKLNRKDGFVFALGCLTVCVTRAGAGGGTPSDWKNDEA